MFKNLLIIFIFFFNFTIKAEEPIWYTNKLNNTKLYLYSSGIGKDMNEAILNALNGIIVLDDNYSNNIHINFTNYTLEDSFKDEDNQYVLIAVKRNELFNLQIDNLKILNKVINDKYMTLSDNNFKNKKTINEIIELIEEAKNKIKIIKTIDTFDDTKITKKYNTIIKEIKNIEPKLWLDVKSNELLIFDDKIKNIIEDYNIKINKNAKDILVFDMEVKKEKIHNSFIVNNKVILSIINNDKIIKYNYKNYESISEKDFDSAYKSNMEKINGDLKNIFNELIGIA